VRWLTGSVASVVLVAAVTGLMLHSASDAVGASPFHEGTNCPRGHTDAATANPA
jgi:hypothetical protein